MIYIALAADIIEFATETIDDDNMKMLCSSKTYYVTWIFWLISLLQFVLISTASKSPRFDRFGATQEEGTTPKMKYRLNSQKSLKPNTHKNHLFLFSLYNLRCCGILENEDLWGMTITLILQDIPFLLARLYLIIKMDAGYTDEGSINQMLIFFTLKNALTIILQIYRFFVICLDADQDGNITEEDIQLIKEARKTRNKNTQV